MLCEAGHYIIRRACHHLPQKVCSRHLSFPTLTTALWFGITVVPFCPNAWKDDAIRMIMRKPRMTRSEPIWATLGWPTLETRRRNAVACLVHICHLGQAHSFLCSKFKSNAQTGYAGTRGENKVHLNRPRTNYYRSTFEFQGASIYNKLLNTIRDIQPPRIFKQAVQNSY